MGPRRPKLTGEQREAVAAVRAAATAVARAEDGLERSVLAAWYSGASLSYIGAPLTTSRSLNTARVAAFRVRERATAKERRRKELAREEGR